MTEFDVAGTDAPEWQGAGSDLTIAGAKGQTHLATCQPA